MDMDMDMEMDLGLPINRDDNEEERAALSSSSSSSPPPSPPPASFHDELKGLPPKWALNKRRLSKQLSMCETARDIAWEKRRRQILRQERFKKAEGEFDDVTDEDLSELKGCIELGFGFNEEAGHGLCNTLPALDLYFAVNRQFSTSPASSPQSRRSTSSLGDHSSSFGSSPRSESDWKVCSPGDNPQQVKTKLRHWAQAVACSVMQSY